MKGEQFALFLGMLCGDGHLGIRTKEAGYENFSVEFCNTDIELVKLFDKLLYDIFHTKGNFHSRIRGNRKEIFEFRKYSKDIFDEIASLGFPIGIKRDLLRIPPLIWSGTRKEKELFFKGVLITDGCVRKNKTIIFHFGSKLFLEDLSKLINELFGIKKEIKTYIQRDKYTSYQLSLNKKESQKILMPPSHSGIASVLSLEN